MNTVLLSCFLLAIVAVGILLTPYEGFDSLTDKRTWISAMTKWQTAYALNKKNATPLQTQYNALLTADTALNRIDSLIKSPYNLTDAQISSIYQSETASMNKDLAFWTSVSAVAATPTLPSPALTGLLASPSASGSGLVAPPSNPIMQSAAANTISRSVDEKADATETKSPSDWHRCPDMSKYIKKDEIPCWNCTL
jgi:hypothetical protein